MNHGLLRKFSLCFSVALLLAGCQSKASTFLPVTGVEEVALPATVARDQVLGYLLSSSRLPGVPSSADWQQDGGEAPEGGYHLVAATGS